jgi:hypothetical protein
MDKGTLFWIVFVISLLFGGFRIFRAEPANRLEVGGDLIFYVLVGILGWQVFGPVLK